MSSKLSLIALGANLSSSSGTPAQTLREALRLIAALPEISLVAVSRFYATPAFPEGSGPDFVNGCAAILTSLSAEDLLAEMHLIEADLGRTRDPARRWVARGIDIDLLAMEDAVLPDAATQNTWRMLPPAEQQATAPDRLILPHPRMQDRSFVLVPLADIAPGWVHPGLGLSVARMLAARPAAERNSARVFLDNPVETDQVTVSAPDLIPNDR